MNVVLETERLVLRTWTLEDVDDAFGIWGDPEVMRYVDSGRPFPDVEAARRALTRAIAVQEEHGLSLWPVVEKSSRRLIGCCGFHLYEGGPELELAYHFARTAWGRGYATEAARACLRYAFEKLRPPKIIAAAHPENRASWRVLEKIGFEYVGMLREDEIEEKFYVATPGGGGAPPAAT